MMTDLKGYFYYGTSRYDVTLSRELHNLWRDFILRVCGEMDKKCGNFPLPDPNIIDLEISGDGWRVTDVGGEG